MQAAQKLGTTRRVVWMASLALAAACDEAEQPNTSGPWNPGTTFDAGGSASSTGDGGVPGATGATGQVGNVTTGGGATGGATAGGSTAGNATGGAITGGAITGGETTGGETTGGETTGGETTGGETTGGETTGGETSDQPHCLDGITDYAGEGPFDFETARSGSVNIWVPDVPAGCKVPVVHLANGTGARCSSYTGVLEHLASHGFLTACYEDTNTGQGTQCVTALETLFEEYPDLADKKIGSTGHSQGGGAAIVCIYRAEQQWGDEMIYAGHAMEPAHGYGDAPRDYGSLYAQIRSPIFMFNGSVDGLVSASWVGRGFSALDDQTEAHWYEAVGAAHIPIPTRWTQESTAAWFRWKLLGDKQACEYFKNMPNTDDWELQEVQNETDC